MAASSKLDVIHFSYGGSMKTKLITTAALVGLGLLAADKMQPIKAKLGLWEITATSSSQMSGMPAMPSIPPEKLAQMPPAQRAQVEAMLKQASGAPTVTTTQTCITQEKLDKAQFNQERGSCKRTIVNSTSKLLEMHLECVDEKGNQSTSDVKYEVTGDNTMKGTNKIKANASGHAINMNIDLSGKWLAADCGAVTK
jgi:hypothetical protein